MDIIFSILTTYRDVVSEYYFTGWFITCFVIVFGLSLAIAVSSDNKESLFEDFECIRILATASAGLILMWWALLPILIAFLSFYGLIYFCSFAARKITLFIMGTPFFDGKIFRQKDTPK